MGNKKLVLVPIALLALGAFAGCVRGEGPISPLSTVASGGGSDFGDDFEGLTVGTDGLVRAIVTRVMTPTTVMVNRKYPRKVRFAAVVGPDEKTDPDLYEAAKGHIYEFTGRGNPVFIRPLPGLDLSDNRVDIVGFPMLVAERQPDPDRTTYVDLVQSMLSRGLLKISDYNEFNRPEVARAAVQAEEVAKRNKIGMWRAYRPSMPTKPK